MKWYLAIGFTIAMGMTAYNQHKDPSTLASHKPSDLTLMVVVVTFVWPLFILMAVFYAATYDRRK